MWTPGGGFKWDTLRSSVLDEFVVAHLVGWWAKALALRNYTLLLIGSLLFELLEYTFKYVCNA